jgi:hypothetical protein
MAEKIKLVQGDTKPALVVSLTDESTGSPIDVSGATTRLKFRAAGTLTVLSTTTATKIAGRVTEDGTIDSTAPYDVPGKGGRVQFNWAAGSLDVPPGDYEGEIEISYPDSTIQTVYDVLKFKVREDF